MGHRRASGSGPLLSAPHIVPKRSAPVGQWGVSRSWRWRSPWRAAGAPGPASKRGCRATSRALRRPAHATRMLAHPASLLGRGAFYSATRTVVVRRCPPATPTGTSERAASEVREGPRQRRRTLRTLTLTSHPDWHERTRSERSARGTKTTLQNAQAPHPHQPPRLARANAQRAKCARDQDNAAERSGPSPSPATPTGTSERAASEVRKGPRQRRRTLRPLTVCRHHPSAAASHRRSVALGAVRILRPSSGDGLSILTAPNALRHFSVQNKKGWPSHPIAT